MWKNFLGLGGAVPPAQPPDEDENYDDDTAEGEEVVEDLNDEFLDMDEDEVSWLCRACMKPIRDSFVDGDEAGATEPYEQSQGFRIHQRCVHCCICKIFVSGTDAIRVRNWTYCQRCSILAHLEATLHAGAEQWRYTRLSIFLREVSFALCNHE
jgi:hypothetical protein